MSGPPVPKIALVVAGIVVLAVLAGAAVVWFLGLVTWQRHIGYFGPAFSPDGKAIYAIVRETQGATWGFGWEHFTPPAYAYPVSDHLSLVRLDVASGTSEVLETWSSTPVLRRVIREYRSRIFNSMYATVRPQPDGAVKYSVEMSIPKIPASDTHLLTGVWAAGAARQRGEWTRGGYRAGTSEPVVAGLTEVFAVQGVEAFPCGVVLLDHGTMATRPLTWSADCRRRYPAGPPRDKMVELSQKPQLDRVADLSRTRDAQVAKYRAQGLSEGDAQIKAIRDLEDMGKIPRGKRLVAERTDAPPGELPLFEIEDGEMASGIFRDIERAIASPGAEIDKGGRYLIHRDYTTSARLNAWLDGGGREFVVRYRGGTYRLEIR
jgi:hypothetical protein